MDKKMSLSIGIWSLVKYLHITMGSLHTKRLQAHFSLPLTIMKHLPYSCSVLICLNMDENPLMAPYYKLKRKPVCREIGSTKKF